MLGTWRARSTPGDDGLREAACDSLQRMVEARGIEPEPDPQDEARVHVSLGLVTGVAGEDLVTLAVGDSANSRRP